MFPAPFAVRAGCHGSTQYRAGRRGSGVPPLPPPLPIVARAVFSSAFLFFNCACFRADCKTQRSQFSVHGSPVLTAGGAPCGTNVKVCTTGAEAVQAARRSGIVRSWFWSTVLFSPSGCFKSLCFFRNNDSAPRGRSSARPLFSITSAS